MNKELPTWEVKLVGGGAIGETGDYDDAHWELTDGKLSIFTIDDDQSDETEEKQFFALVDALNATRARFWVDESWMLELGHYKQYADELQTELAAKDKEIERLTGLLQTVIVGNARILLEGPNAAIIAAKTWENFKTEHNL